MQYPRMIKPDTRRQLESLLIQCPCKGQILPLIFTTENISEFLPDWHLESQNDRNLRSRFKVLEIIREVAHIPGTWSYSGVEYIVGLAFQSRFESHATQNILNHISISCGHRKSKCSKAHCGTICLWYRPIIGPSICATHLRHAPPFVWDK